MCVCVIYQLFEIYFFSKWISFGEDYNLKSQRTSGFIKQVQNFLVFFFNNLYRKRTITRILSNENLQHAIWVAHNLFGSVLKWITFRARREMNFQVLGKKFDYAWLIWYPSKYSENQSRAYWLKFGLVTQILHLITYVHWDFFLLRDIEIV